MYANLVCSPALGQTTVVAPGTQRVRFTALIETESDKAWEVALWHNHGHPDTWEKLMLSEDEPQAQLFVDHGDANNCRRRWFSGELTGPPRGRSHASFTITFRAGKDEPWKWANEQFSFSDGHLIYQADIPQAGLSQYISNISSDLVVDEQAAQTPNTLLWTVSGKVGPASGSTSGWAHHTLGKPVECHKWFALVRLWSPWLAPRHGKGDFAPDKEAVLASFLRNDGQHVVILAVSVSDVLTELVHQDGHVQIRGRNDGEEQDATAIVAVSSSFEIANAATMYHARRLVMKYGSPDGTSGNSGSTIEAEMKEVEGNKLKAQWLEEWYDGLAYCTWNGLGQHLTEAAIFNALDQLESNDINVTNLIIDDNWQSLDHEGEDQFKRGWKEFEANKAGFPNGLAHTARTIRERHKNISHIAVWHAILGYWGGISPDGKIADEYQTAEVQKKPGVSAGKMLVVDEQDVHRLYQDFYSFLESAGIDSVKTDAQFFLDELDTAPERRRLIKTYQDAWSINILRHFSAKAISCMSQVPQILFHSQMPTNKPRLMVRNSDDFFPEVPASHPWHIFCNAYNALFTQHLNVLPDWDMFQTSHPWATFHGAARCVSGGPIYITDVPGQHDVDLIRQMTANTPRGDTVILRPDVIGKTIDAYAGYDEHQLLKIGTYVGRAQTGTGILGVFNTTQRRLTELLTLDQFPGTEFGTYVVRSHRTGQTSSPFSRQSTAFVHVDIAVQSWEILSAVPVGSYELPRLSGHGSGSPKVDVAVLGLLGKMTGSAAIVNTDSYVEREGGRHLRVWTSLKALGTYGLWISDLENRNLETDFLALLFGQPISLGCVAKNENVLEIDLARAWKENDQKAGWSNEVAIEVIIR
ncbi:glycoside hydrolase family 36 protein [Aplosporella prunicola CBS 121167]|uniref:Glycoside hydrolase family 36 protein n=1 Tax=Aplosporella prunicola CBS 121167 TaxID=1176127 RepID=A0A6A6B9C2_9PEZI|nr:glycoside hydrolase family 36 protein [Aplosporella prunicola CBS 121167]KAF2140819.1 glycoside hydrolase family 36 protein [Aplosporella prunicola CBS 121167]